MNRVKIRVLLLLLTCLLFLSGCASTRIVASWSDEAYRNGQFSKPLILATSKKQIIRSKAEDGFVQELRAIGVDAVQSYKFFPGMEDLRPDLIKAKLSGSDRDSILVIHLVDVKMKPSMFRGEPMSTRPVAVTAAQPTTTASAVTTTRATAWSVHPPTIMNTRSLSWKRTCMMPLPTSLPGPS